MPELTLLPAYGRDYKNRQEVMKDFLLGKDFEIANPGYGRYMGVQDLVDGPSVGSHLRFRYDKQRKVFRVPVLELLMDYNGK